MCQVAAYWSITIIMLAPHMLENAAYWPWRVTKPSHKLTCLKLLFMLSNICSAFSTQRRVSRSSSSSVTPPAAALEPAGLPRAAPLALAVAPMPLLATSLPESECSPSDSPPLAELLLLLLLLELPDSAMAPLLCLRLLRRIRLALTAAAAAAVPAPESSKMLFMKVCACGSRRGLNVWLLSGGE